MQTEGIGWAVKQMQNGARVRRSGWNGKGMWLILVRGSQWDMAHDLEHAISAVDGLQGRDGYSFRSDFVAMRTADGALVPWLCSQTDLLAIDWEIVE